ncbi:CrcB family protein [Planococcus sp. CP5-4]|uniref:fluoride efflux transporter FluC n=1 Tax=unclassified Planococcus (in: firmicutes) TaxID=2662419 RepID=UPI001C248C04|nr:MULTISPECIES: CrcB family protein [unclassified Planococcus (in: firmicutes)]MBU9672326.1 CrcB family protein [Planococcus sp. CP5-4_YE]MBV0909377.1 CrcB family protein [Planococcus sp. CP5-4_UN]MBW6064106.1 CrcB family protein [Planococcus sp. CP5-4]
MISIAIFGFLGAVARYLCYLALENRVRQPKIATWFVNSLGSLIIGACLGAGLPAASGIFGFLGAFTTFSTMALDGVKDFEDGHWKQGIFYISATLIFGLLLFAAGYSIATM